jgi:hypothetical protein
MNFWMFSVIFSNIFNNFMSLPVMVLPLLPNDIGQTNPTGRACAGV